MPRRNRPYPAPVRARDPPDPGLQAFRRRFVFDYGESLTAMIRNPRTLGRLGKLRSTLFMRMQLRDPEVRRKVWPDYTFGCKRILFSSRLLPALQRPNVELLTDPITTVTETGIRTADGVVREVDCIIWGTGFQDERLHVPDGGHAAVAARRLTEAWSDGPTPTSGSRCPAFRRCF